LENIVPEQVYPFFIFTELPAGIAGFVISGLLAAAMSTLDSSINALAATVTTDFYRRLLVRNREDRHYLRVGRWFSVLFGCIMIGSALIIHLTRSQTLLDLQTLILSLLSGGILGLFLLGFLTERVDGQAALIATLSTIAGISFWLLAETSLGQQFFPGLAGWLPDKFWIMTLANTFLFGLGYVLGLLMRRRPAVDLAGLTVRRMRHRDQPERET
jgi:SSS family solute:Na+ symporter